MHHKTLAPPPIPPHPSAARAAIIRLLPLWGLLLMLALVSYPQLSRDLWTDEAYTLSYTSHPTLGALLDDVRKNEETPPIYFVSVWLWSRVFGDSEVSIRALSMLYGAGAILGMAEYVRRRLEPEEAAVAALVMAAAPLLQSYMLEARGYTMTVLLTVACVVAFERLYAQPESRRAQLTYALSAAALLLTSYFSVALLAAHWLISLSLLRAPSTRRGRLAGWALVHLIIAACALPWLPSLRYQMLVAPAVTANWSGGPRDYYFMAFGSLMGNVRPGAWLVVWLAAAAAGFTLMLAAALGRRAAGGIALRALALPAATLMLMVVMLHVVATRYMIVILPGSAIAAGVGFAALRGRRPWLAWTLLALLVGGGLLVRVAAEPSDPMGAWGRLSDRVAAEADPADDLVIFYPPWDQRIFEYYYSGPELPMAGAHHYDDFYYSQGHALRQTWTLPEALAAIAGHRRVWVFYDQLHHQVPPVRLPYRQIGHWQEGKLELFLYEVTPP
ncbi:glycosyltransferase family 39 protein [Oscillochloris sp. ZM17-4]|uniref:glycosyltransferase family 39 protein n=1 Tax=Oscillochloris sp. ZM17-4 TaxID=2866714 RepID=UPI001C735A0E|nr:glycosyltransferase family 39 protein [Oscillochloris sp. ZM17-4]MBX0328772.1 glycosyltransferase family 39 protein [Oscillochloris sp. ZM17-4]